MWGVWVYELAEEEDLFGMLDDDSSVDEGGGWKVVGGVHEVCKGRGSYEMHSEEISNEANSYEP